MSNTAIEGLIAAIFVLLALSVVVGVAAVGCHSRWAESGLESKYRPLAGCRVSLDGGKTYIPENRYRVLPE